MRPSASEEQIAEAVEQELIAEGHHCYGFQPTVELMRAARANGLGIIIVSDTYLSEPQLRRLIGETAGEEALGLIDRIFCSSEHRSAERRVGKECGSTCRTRGVADQKKKK